MKDLRFNEKGKYFTTQVKKRSIQVTLATAGNIFRGLICLIPENRLKDELNNEEQFIALTETQVFAIDGVTFVNSVPLVVLNKEHIVWVFPQSEDNASPQGSGEEI